MAVSPEAPSGGDAPSGVDAAVMAARYGRSGAGPARSQLVVAAVVAGVILVAVVVVQALSLGRPAVTSQDLGFTVESPTLTTVRFNLITDPGTTVRCTLTALNESFTEVGFREVVVGPVGGRTTSHEAAVTTSELATTGSVSSCEILDAD